MLEQAGYLVNVTEVVAVEVADRPGGLVGLLELFEAGGINIEYMYAFTFGREDKAVLVFRFDQPDAAIDRLRAAGINVSWRRTWGSDSRVSVARTIQDQIERASWIRRMFEEGIRLRQERGAENVFDFTLGNPEVEPPEAVIAALRRVVAENRPRSHGYMPNAGFPAVRAVIARRLAERTGLDFTEEDVLMTVGAAGAINTLLKSILDPGDEVIVLNPYFPEYRFYIENHARARGAGRDR